MPEFYHSQQIEPWMKEEINNRMDPVHIHRLRIQIFTLFIRDEAKK